MKRLAGFLKDWTLVLAMAAGAVSYLVYMSIPCLSSAGPALYKLVTALQPVLLFSLLFLAFCGISPKDMRPRKWHLWLLCFQVTAFVMLALLEILLPGDHWKVLLESGMLLFICPTATAAAVVTAKLDGDAPGITTYLILANFVTAVAVPVVVPLVHPDSEMTFMLSFSMIMAKVFPLLICPCILAWIVRFTMPRFHRKIVRLQNLPFYLLLGIVAGFVSCYFLFMNEKIGQYFSKINKPWKRILIGGISLSLLIFIFPPLYGEGFNFLSDIFTGNYSNLFNNTVFYSLQNNYFVFFGFILILILIKVIATGLTNGAGGVGGVFAPSMFVGAFLGLFLAQLLNVIFGLNLPVPNFAMAGMAALMAGVMHAPLTAIFLVAEITGGYNFFIPLMVVSASAYLVSRYFNPHSIYTKSLALRGELLTHNKDTVILSMMSIERLIEHNFVTVKPEDSLGNLVKAISQSSRNIYPVTDEKGHFYGLVFLDDIKTLIFRPELYNQILVKDLMYMPKTIIYRQETMEEVAKKFQNSKDYNIPVLEGEKYVGFVSRANVFSNYRVKVKEFSND